MRKLNIYNHNGVKREIDIEILPGSSVRYMLMNDDYIKLKFILAEPFPFKMGDYIDAHESYIDDEGITHFYLDGSTLSHEGYSEGSIIPILKARFYELTESYSPKYNTTNGGYEYELKFNAYYKKWANKTFKLVTMTDRVEDVVGQSRGEGLFSFHRSESSWSLTATLSQHIEMAIKNLFVIGGHAYMFSGNEITYNIDSSVKTDAIAKQYDNQNIHDALIDLAEECECDFWVDNNVIRFGRLENKESVTEVVIGDNVMNIESKDSQNQFATRLYAYGSDKNIPATYRKKLEFTKSKEGNDLADSLRPLRRTYFEDSQKHYKESLFEIPAKSEIRANYAESIICATYQGGQGILRIPNFEYKIRVALLDEDLDKQSLDKLYFTYYASNSKSYHKWKRENQKTKTEETCWVVKSSRAIYEYANSPIIGIEKGKNKIKYSLPSNPFSIDVVAIKLRYRLRLGESEFVLSEKEYNELSDEEKERNEYIEEAYIDKVLGTYYMPGHGEESVEQEKCTVFNPYHSSYNDDISLEYEERDVKFQVFKWNTDINVELDTAGYEVGDTLRIGFTFGGFTENNNALYSNESEDELLLAPYIASANIGLNGSAIYKSLSEIDFDIQLKDGETHEATLSVYSGKILLKNEDIDIPKDTCYTIPDILQAKVPVAYYKDAEDNFVTNSVVKRRLMLPTIPYDATEEDCAYKGKGFVDAYEDLEDCEIIEDTAVFDDVFPHKEDIVTDVKPYEYTKTETDANTGEEIHTPWNAYLIKAEYLSDKFSEDYIINDEEGLHVTFKSGRLAGMTFEVKFGPAHAGDTSEDLQEYSKCFEIIANEDYGRHLPDDVLYPSAKKGTGTSTDPNSANYEGDKFVLYGYDASAVDKLLVGEAEKKLLDEARKYMRKAKYYDKTYSMTLFPDYAVGKVFDLGDLVSIPNPNFFEDERNVRVIGYEIQLDLPYNNPKYELGENIQYSHFKDIDDKLKEIASNGKVGTYNNSGRGGSAIPIIKSTDTTAPTDTNVYSALRVKKDLDTHKNDARKEYLSRYHDEETSFGLTAQSLTARGDLTARDSYLTGNTQFTNNQLQKNMSGGGVYTDEEGNAVGEFDMLFVHKQLFAKEAVIEQVNYIGGTLVLTPADGFTIAFVEEIKTSGRVTAYRLFFKAVSENGKEVRNMWQEDDFALSQSFSYDGDASSLLEGTAYWWRCVTASGTMDVTRGDITEKYNYIDVSNIDKDEKGVSVPKEGETVVQLGNKHETARQKAIIISAIGNNAPNIYLYKGINTFSLNESREVGVISPDGVRFLAKEFRFISDNSQDTLEDLLNRIEAMEDIDGFEIYHSLDSNIPLPYYDVVSKMFYNENADGYSDRFFSEWEAPGEHIGDYLVDENGQYYRFEAHILIPVGGGKYDIYTDQDIDTNDYTAQLFWVRVTDNYVAKTLEDLERVKGELEGIESMMKDGYFDIDEKVLLQSQWETTKNAALSIQKRYEYITAGDIVKSDEYTNIGRMYNAVFGEAGTYTILSTMMEEVLTQPYTRTEIPEGYLTKWVNYKNSYDALEGALSKGQQAYIESIDGTNRIISNYFEETQDENGNYTQSVKSGGLVTEAGFAEMFARKVTHKILYTGQGSISRTQNEVTIPVEIANNTTIEIDITTQMSIGGQVEVYAKSESSPFVKIDTLVMVGKKGMTKLKINVATVSMKFVFVNLSIATQAVIAISDIGRSFEAVVKTTVEDDEALVGIIADRVDIDAERIDLQGYMSVNGNFFINKKGALFADNGTFSGMALSKLRVITKQNEKEYGYHWIRKVPDKNGVLLPVDEYHLDIRKAGEKIAIYSGIGNPAYPEASETSEETIGLFAGEYHIGFPSVSQNIDELEDEYYNKFVVGRVDDFEEVYDFYGAMDFIGKSIEVINWNMGGSDIILHGQFCDSTHFNTLSEITLHVDEIIRLTCISQPITEQSGYTHYATMWEVDKNLTTPFYQEFADGKKRSVHILAPQYNNGETENTFHWLPNFHMATRFFENDYISVKFKEILYEEWLKVKNQYNRYGKIYSANTGDANYDEDYMHLKEKYRALQDLCEVELYEITDVADATLFDENYMQYDTIIGPMQEDLRNAWTEYYFYADILDKKTRQ